MDRRVFGRCVLAASAAMPAHRDLLCRLDTGIGDGDHGVTVERGFSAVTVLFSGDPAEADQAFYHNMGNELSTRMGGAIGPIYDLFFQGIGAGLRQAETINARVLGEAMVLAAQKIMRIAKAQPGEKTILDAMQPASEALLAAVDLPLSDALRMACLAAERGAESTRDMLAVKGRARFLKEKSIGYRDAGASSFTLYLEALTDAVIKEEG